MTKANPGRIRVAVVLPHASFRRKPECSGAEGVKQNWTPAFAGVTEKRFNVTTMTQPGLILLT
jgi:hypothetical protein